MQAQETTKLYLCSGGADVRAYRDGLAAALSGIPEIDLVRPEDFGADNPAPGWAAARECGLFIAVMGHCYGALDPASGKSFTERELELAAAEGIPFHAYLAPGDFMVPAHLLTADSDPARQDALRQRTGAERGFSQMETPDDLARTVIGAVRRWLAETGTDAAADPSAPAGPPAPAPPEPDFAAPRFAPPLFAGRDDERRRLDTWWAAPAAVGFAIDGPMGVGKSALAQAWLDGGFDAAPPEGVVYWSFRNAPGNFRALAERVLTYMGRDETAWSTAHARLDHLGQCLRDHRLLVVLDDFETELRDDGRDARSCRSHETAAFLRLLNAAADMPMRGKVLIVTRHPPAELEIAETSRLTLGGLPAAAAEVLATPEIAAAATACENHPLALRLLAGLAGAGDDISRLKPDQARARTLAAAHEALPAEARGVLAILAASRTPISPKLLAVAHADDGDLDAALGRLAKHGFLDRSAADGTVGMHPGLAADVYGRIGDPAAAHERLCAAYRHASADRPDAIRRLDDMGPLIELFHHTAAAGRPDDAYKLFSGRMANWLQYRFGDHETIAALLESLIPADGVPHPNLSSATEQGRCLTHLAQALRRTGNRQRLTAIEVATTELDAVTGNIWYRSVSLHQLAWTRKSSGEFKLAAANADESVRLAEACANHHVRAKSLELAADLLICRGRFDAGRDMLGEARAAWRDMDDQVFRTAKTLLREDAAIACQLALWTGDAAAARRHAAEALSLARADNDQPSMIAAKVLEAQAALAAAEPGGELTAVGRKLDPILDDSRRLGLTSLTAKARLVRARYLRASGDPEAARVEAEELRSDSRRRDLRLHTADTEVLLAEIALGQGEREVADTYARAAQASAECDGEGWRYQPAWDRAAEILDGGA